VTFLNQENAATAPVVGLLLERPIAEWRQIARECARQFTFGVLDHLLDVSHEDLDRNASRSLALSRLVVRYSRRIHVPDSASLLVPFLQGRAWKEYGNALYTMGYFPDAYRAASRAVKIFGRESALLVERTAALMLQGMTAHRLERTAEATSILRECSATFLRLGEERRSLQVAIMEAALLYDANEVAAARGAFLVARATAERLGEQRELARVLNNLGQCDVRLGDVDAATRHLRAALDLFEQEGMTAERQRVFWILARIQREHGRIQDAVAQFLQVRRELVSRGMMIDAALAGLDLVELLAATGEHDLVKQEAETLVRVFTAAGMQRNARIALAYLVEQAKLQDQSSTDERRLLWQQDLQRVRIFMTGLRTAPEATFTPPAPH
jgi:tetratricopeptide (TPR) repeat protein